MSSQVSPEEISAYVVGAFGSSWANRDALLREATNRWAPPAVIHALLEIPNRFYRSAADLQDQLAS